MCSMPGWAGKYAGWWSRKFALTLVSVLDIMIMPISAALISSNIISATIRAIPRSDFLAFLPRKRIIVFSYWQDMGAPDAAIDNSFCYSNVEQPGILVPLRGKAAWVETQQVGLCAVKF